MRLYYILGAVAVLLVTPLVQSKVSELNQTQRFLRTHETATEINGDKDIDSKLDDERTINFKQILGLEENVFARNIVSKMKKDKAFKLEMFAKWQEEKLSVGDIAKKLKVPRRSRNIKLLLEYIDHVDPVKVSEATRDRKVTFGGVDTRYFDTDEMLEWLKPFGR